MITDTEGDTPVTAAFREVIIGQYKEDELTGNGIGNILAALPDIEGIEIERDAERALADRLADALTNPATYVALEALAAWKEARSERR